MAKLYFFKYTTIDAFDECKTTQYAGVIAADNYTDAMHQLERQETCANGECDIISIDYLEATDDAVLWTDDLELYAKIYKEMMQ